MSTFHEEAAMAHGAGNPMWIAPEIKGQPSVLRQMNLEHDLYWYSPGAVRQMLETERKAVRNAVEGEQLAAYLREEARADQAEAALGNMRSSIEEAAKAAEILDNLINCIKKHGNYRAESTLVFLSHARQCLNSLLPTGGL